MAAEVAKAPQGTLTIAINPGGKVLYPGAGVARRVRDKTGALAFITARSCSRSIRDLVFSTCRSPSPML